MDPAPQPAPSNNTALLFAVLFAAVAVVGGAGVAGAYFLGLFGGDDNVTSTPTSLPTPGQQLAGTAPDVSLAPGETVVTPPEKPKAVAPAPPMPKPAPPAATPKPAPAPPKPAPAPPPPKVKAAPAPAPTPAPRVAQSPRPPPASEAQKGHAVPPVPGRDYCVNCGVVTSISPRGDAWDVVVRFEDGSSQTLPYPDVPPFHAKDHVHLEDGRLTKD